MKYIVLTVASALICLSCTERRRADAPVPDGDTIEVEIHDIKAKKMEGARRVIVVGPTATPTEETEFAE